MIIDCHNHPNWHEYNFRKHISNMDELGIDKTLLLTWEIPSDEWNGNTNGMDNVVNDKGPMTLENCLDYLWQAPDRFILGYAPDPRIPGALKQLKWAVDTYGVKSYGELKLRMMYNNPDAIRMFRLCGELGLPVTVHIDYEFPSGFEFPRPNYWYGGGIEAFESAIKQCPDTNFLGHAPGFWAHISGDDLFDKEPYPTSTVEPNGKIVEMLRKYPNLYCDISAGSGCNALERDKEFTIGFLDEFQDRVVYARDTFSNIHQQLLNSLELDKTVLDKIYSLNAIKLLHL